MPSAAAMSARSSAASSRRSTCAEGRGARNARRTRTPSPHDVCQRTAQQARRADELDRFADRVGGFREAQRHRLHRRRRGDRRLQQVGVERQQAVAGRRRSLGEDRDHLARAQRLGDRMDDAQRIALSFALEVERPGRVDQPRHQRPRLDVGLGDEARPRNDGVDRHDVEPRDVVGDEQAAASAGVPWCSKAMPRTASIFLDHQRIRSWRAAASSEGNANRTIARPCRP
jgi:hypothetical protein